MEKTLLSLTFLFTLTFSFGQYCVSGGPTSTADSNVESVLLTGASGTINYTGCPGVLGVEEVLSQSATLNAGSSYSTSIQFGTCGGGFFGNGQAWIDYNANMVFEASESIGTWTGTPPTALSVFNFTVPAGATNGTVRMRVMQREGGGGLPLNPCASFTWGSVVDFTIIIQGGVGATYCNAGPSSTADSNIESMTLNGANGTAINYVGCPGVTGLQYYTSQSAELGIGNSYQADIQFGTCNGNWAGAGEAWIDFNQNSVFEASESIGTWQGTPPTALSSFNFTVPAWAVLGPTRMRVIQQEGSTVTPPLNPCATFTWGSATDFDITIIPFFDCSGYIGDDENDPIVVTTFPYVHNHTNSVCYTNQNPVYNSPDVYYLVIPNSSTASLNVSLCGSNFDTFLSVFDTQGNALAINDDSGNCGLQSELVVSVLSEDSVYVIVEGYNTASGDYTLTINETDFVGIDDTYLPGVNLYPNPTNDYFRILGIEEGSIEIIDSKGSLISSEEISNEEMVYVKALEPGIYFISLKSDMGNRVFKLVKE